MMLWQWRFLSLRRLDVNLVIKLQTYVNPAMVVAMWEIAHVIIHTLTGVCIGHIH